jgi:hypothetical protein
MAVDQYLFRDYLLTGTFLMPGDPVLGPDTDRKMAYSVRVAPKPASLISAGPEPLDVPSSRIVDGLPIPGEAEAPPLPEGGAPLFILHFRVNTVDIRSMMVTFDMVRNFTVKKIEEMIRTGAYREGAEYLCDLADLDGSCTMNEL